MNDLILHKSNTFSSNQDSSISDVQSKMYIKLIELLEQGLVEQVVNSDTVLVKEENLNSVRKSFNEIEGFKDLYYLNIFR